VKVQAVAEVDELRLYDRHAVAARSLRSVRSVAADVADPRCPLRWTTVVGRRKACDAPTLAAYLRWLHERGRLD